MLGVVYLQFLAQNIMLSFENALMLSVILTVP